MELLVEAPVLDRFIRGEITPIPTAYTGHIRYEVTPLGVDPTPLRLIGLLPNSDWYIVAQPNGRLSAIRSSNLVLTRPSRPPLRRVLHAMWRKFLRTLVFFKRTQGFWWFMLALCVVGTSGQP